MDGEYDALLWLMVPFTFWSQGRGRTSQDNATMMQSWNLREEPSQAIDRCSSPTLSFLLTSPTKPRPISPSISNPETSRNRRFLSVKSKNKSKKIKGKNAQTAMSPSPSHLNQKRREIANLWRNWGEGSHLEICCLLSAHPSPRSPDFFPRILASFLTVLSQSGGGAKQAQHEEDEDDR
jgi:hypothetical protein